ncbi:MAG: hypothetical protein JXA96_17385 [Sedimentisphaerales bacterium]|nr:hypothetical protein [Sedimentisphaerales bacterium]
MPDKGIVYYTDNILKESFACVIRKILKLSAGAVPIVWVSQKPINEEPNIVVGKIGRNHKSICIQILEGLKSLSTDIVFLAEHDVIYHPSHFYFMPPREDIFYYNRNRYWLDSRTGQASTNSNCFGALSQLSSYRKLAEVHYEERLNAYNKGINVRKFHGTEPGKHKGNILTNYGIDEFFSEWPNIDIRHDKNFTKSDRFKGNYILVDTIPYWGRTKNRYEEFIDSLRGESVRSCNYGNKLRFDNNGIGYTE